MSAIGKCRWGKWKAKAIFLFLLFACANVAAGQDAGAEMLEKLVSRGVLSEEEALEVRKSAAAVESKTPASKVRLFTFIHTRYQYTKQTYSNAPSLEKNGFAVRRLIPVVLADISEKANVQIALFFPSNAPINATHFEYKVDTEYIKGAFWLGYETAFFCMEEPESGTRIMTPDRSILNMYFGGGDHGFYDGNALSYTTPVAFSGYHTGVFWHGKFLKNESIIYRLAVTNSKPEKVGFGGENGYAFWASLGYDKKIGEDSIRFGVNCGYSTSVVSAVDSYTTPARVADFGDAWGINPYILIKKGPITFHSEFMLTAVQYGASTNSEIPHYCKDSPQAVPWGFYVLLAYKFDLPPLGQFEPVVRFTHLNTDGRGVTEGAVLYRTENWGGLFDKVNSYYAGINWYVLGNSLKYTFCVEYADFYGGVAGGADRSDGALVAMAQVQIVF